MRITDMLQTETPRPALEDRVFEGFVDICPNPVVVDATDVATLFMEMTINNEAGKSADEREEIKTFEAALGTSTGWQVASFFQFDFSTLGCCAPPFENFVIEFDMRQASEDAAKALGQSYDPRDTVDFGKTAASFSTFTREDWINKIQADALYRKQGNDIGGASGPTVRELEDLPFRWMMCVLTWRSEPGYGLRGPLSTWIIPLDDEGKVFIEPDGGRVVDTDKPMRLMHASGLGPHSRDRLRSNSYALSQGWTVLVPALLALNFMHTPRTTKKAEGYHDLVEHEETGRIARKYLERNFRPMVKWHTLDITPLREAVRRAHGGSMPRDFGSLAKALHVVRGHSATYMPNTYFGRQHDRPITVFRPSFRRGDIRAGIIAKEYHLDAGEASA
jgi:hypothetical protein